MRLLIIEDDINLLKQISKVLKNEGYSVISCSNAEDAQYYADNNMCDLAVIDRMLPKMDGITFLKSIRNKQNNFPAIILTALDTIEDRLEGLNSGADDYLSKPFDIRELVARIKVLERRPPQITANDKITAFDFVYDVKAYVLTGPSASATLTKKTGEMLSTFLKETNYTISRHKLFNKVWGIDSDVEESNVDSYAYFLRKKLAEIGSSVKLVSKKGIGYSLVLENRKEF